MNNKFLLGYPEHFQDLCFVYPPKIKDVVGNDKYNIYLRSLTLTQEELEDEYAKQTGTIEGTPTPFEYIIGTSYNSPEFRQTVNEAFLFFIHEPITFLYTKKLIVIGDIDKIESVEKMRTITENNFFDFQNLIRQANGGKSVEAPRADLNPKIREMKRKARYRDMIKAKSGKGLNLETLLASIFCMNYGLNPLNIGELSYAAIPTLISTYQEKEKYELDVSSLLAGADSKKIKPKYWIHNLD